MDNVDPTPSRKTTIIISARCGFSLTELIVVISIVILLAGTLWFFSTRGRLKRLRATCRSNAGVLAQACQVYAMDFTTNRYGHANALPSGASTDAGWNTMTGHLGGMGLLYDDSYVGREYFICPEAAMRLNDEPLSDDHEPADRGYFFKKQDGELGSTLSYAYLIQFYDDDGTVRHTALGARDRNRKRMDPSMIIIGDDSPQVDASGSATGVAATTNSANHAGDGQNVGRLDGSAVWLASPGVPDPGGTGKNGVDNIYGVGMTGVPGAQRASLRDVLLAP